jgi:hypothetical protein
MSGTVPDLDGCEQSERADRYRQKAAHFKDMASTETHPRVRAQLLGLAKEYDELADTDPRKPSINLFAARAGNNLPGIAVSWGDMRAKPPPGPPGQERDVRVRRR